jgi:uncharacterized membrane protein
MSGQTLAFATIVGMAVATYLTRVGGYWLMAAVRPGPFARRFLEQVPGSIFVALTAPLLVEGGPPEWLGAAVALLAARLTGNLMAGLGGGVAAVVAARHLL